MTAKLTRQVDLNSQGEVGSIEVNVEKSAEQQSWERIPRGDRVRQVIAEMARDRMHERWANGEKHVTYEECHKECVRIAEYRDLQKRKAA